jgi:hypothetical protein
MDTWDAYADQWQEILNRRPPPRRSDERPLNNVPVRLRIVWEREGEEHADTIAQAWAQSGRDRLVYCVVDDHRWRWVGTWFDIQDAPRR